MGVAVSHLAPSRFHRVTANSQSPLLVEPPQASAAPYKRPTRLQESERGRWGGVPSTEQYGSGGGGGQPVGEGVECSWPSVSDAAHHSEAATRLPASVDGSTAQGLGVASEHDVRVTFHSPTANPAVSFSGVSSTSVVAASATNLDMGAVTWMASEQRRQHHQQQQGLVLSTTASKMDALEQFPSLVPLDLTTAMQRGSVRGFGRKASSKEACLGLSLLPSASVQARFEFMFEDMLGVSSVARTRQTHM